MKKPFLPLKWKRAIKEGGSLNERRKMDNHLSCLSWCLNVGLWMDGDEVIKFDPDKMNRMIEDEINKPNHYHKNEIDVNGYLEKHFPKESNVTVSEGFYMGNVIKYVSRHKEKGGLKDLEKAQYYLERLIENRRKENEK